MGSLDHERFMRRATALTANCPRLPFGAVTVRGDMGEVVAEGWNRSAINPTWHEEIDAINRLAGETGAVARHLPGRQRVLRVNP